MRKGSLDSKHGQKYSSKKINKIIQQIKAYLRMTEEVTKGRNIIYEVRRRVHDEGKKEIGMMGIPEKKTHLKYISFLIFD